MSIIKETKRKTTQTIRNMKVKGEKISVLTAYDFTMASILDEAGIDVILVGDFNQTPYSFVYNSFKEIMNNAFETAGNGFGFTYRGSTLFFLRIDNQFYDPRLKAIDFKTHKQVPYSDHYPIEARYLIVPD